MKPYGNLHIYMVKGRISEEMEGVFGDSFLGNWIEDDWSFLFFSSPAREEVDAAITGRLFSGIADEFCFSYDEWQGGAFGTQTIGRFRVVPPWESEGERQGGALTLILDPGVVFGTGLHPTTRDCLRALTCVSQMTPVRKVLDLGTGTGILSLAAVAIGAESVLAVDLNPLCVRTARRNAELNGFASEITVIEGDADQVPAGGADLVMANIHYGAMLSLLEGKGPVTIPLLLLSGLLRTQARDVEDRARGIGYRVLRRWDQEMTWYTMLLKREQGKATLDEIS